MLTCVDQQTNRLDMAASSCVVERGVAATTARGAVAIDSLGVPTYDASELLHLVTLGRGAGAD